MPKPYLRVIRIAVATLVSVGAVAPGPAYAGAVTGNATEWTQLLNNAELIGLSAQSAEQIQNQLTQITQLAEQIQNQIRIYENMLQNTLQLPTHIWSQVEGDLARLQSLVNQGEGIAFAMGNIDDVLKQRFQSFVEFETGLANGEDFSSSYRTWSDTNRDTIAATLRASGLTAEQLGTSASVDSTAGRHNAGRMAMARRALRELEPGNVVNLGIGIPTLVGELIEPRHQVVIHTENGMLGVGPAPQAGGARDFPVNAGKAPVTALPGASYFDSAESFALIRGGHVDVAIMGALQVDSHGSLANWAVPGGNQLGVGGAMDLAVGARRLIIVMTHTDRHGRPKLVETCTLPLTAKGVVDMVITDLGVFSFPDGHLTLLELQPGASLSQVKETTAANFRIAESVIPVAPDTATGSRE